MQLFFQTMMKPGINSQAGPLAVKVQCILAACMALGKNLIRSISTGTLQACSLPISIKRGYNMTPKLSRRIYYVLIEPVKLYGCVASSVHPGFNPLNCQ
jgi:hypothetical protein